MPCGKCKQHYVSKSNRMNTTEATPTIHLSPVYSMSLCVRSQRQFQPEKHISSLTSVCYKQGKVGNEVSTI